MKLWLVETTWGDALVWAPHSTAAMEVVEDAIEKPPGLPHMQGYAATCQEIETVGDERVGMIGKLIAPHRLVVKT